MKKVPNKFERITLTKQNKETIQKSQELSYASDSLLFLNRQFIDKRQKISYYNYKSFSHTLHEGKENP